MQGVVTIHIKQSGKYRISVSNGRPQFLHIVYTFVISRYDRCREPRIKQYRVYRLSIIIDSRNSIKNLEYLLEFKPNSKSLQIPIRGLGGTHSWKNQDARNLVRLSFWTFRNLSIKNSRLKACKVNLTCFENLRQRGMDHCPAAGITHITWTSRNCML